MSEADKDKGKDKGKKAAQAAPDGAQPVEAGGDPDAKAKRDPAAKAAAKAAKAAKADKADKGKAAKTQGPDPADLKRAAPPRLQVRYRQEAVPSLMREFGFRNPMQVPRLRKIVLNMGLGESTSNPKIVDSAVEELTAIAGQKPVVTIARKAIANFKLRRGLKIGAMVTLRRERMWEFLDRLATIALPRVRDFKGVPPKAFDGRGNYTLGLREQTLFPEVNYDKVDKVKGMNITFVTTARTDEQGRALLRSLGMPFRSQ